MSFIKRLFSFMLSIFFILPSIASAAAGKILFIPHDDRPISYHQTVDVLKQAGYKMILPPQELLSNATSDGSPDELWQWLEKNASDAKCAVIASDSMLYGGLIPSRKHHVSQEKLAERLENFKKLRTSNPSLRVYIFDSLMRTPSKGTEGDIEEPDYYGRYGTDFFMYSALADMQETMPISQEEEMALEEHRNSIPATYFEDWSARRAKNLKATEKLMDYARDGVIDYLILGRDDNAPFCQTHRENREILAYAAKNNLPKTKFQSMPGIDEFNILLLTRAVNDMTKKTPSVYVKYNEGMGGDTVPAFSDEKISASVDASLTIAGGLRVSDPAKADFVLLVNTEKSGNTLGGHNTWPDGSEFHPNLIADDDTKYFADMVEDFVKKGYPVGIADIKYCNGADNALMNLLQKKDLLLKLKAYSGWNTATNSTGFALGTGMLAPKMNKNGRNRLLATRYLDDWAYQANVRTIVGNELVRNFGKPEYYIALKDKLSFAEERNTELTRDFAKKNLPQLKILKDFKVKNPWLRMFECDIVLK